MDKNDKTTDQSFAALKKRMSYTEKPVSLNWMLGFFMRHICFLIKGML